MKKIAFLDFWEESQEKLLEIFKEFLSLNNYEISTPEKADLIIYSVFGNSRRDYSARKLLFSGENCKRWTQYNYSDFADRYVVTNFPQDYNLPKQKIIYSPYFAFDYNNIKHHIPNSAKKKFCCIVVSYNDSNPGCILRKKVFDLLCNYKKVDSAGKCFNNVGYLAPRNTEEYFNWINQYKFMITFENSFGNGYVTEKLFNGLCSGVIPIYWGDTSVAKQVFNSNSFICLEDTSDTGIENLIQKIIQLDNSDSDYDNINLNYPFLEKTNNFIIEIKNKIKPKKIIYGLEKDFRFFEDYVRSLAPEFECAVFTDENNLIIDNYNENFFLMKIPKKYQENKFINVINTEQLTQGDWLEYLLTVKGCIYDYSTANIEILKSKGKEAVHLPYRLKPEENLKIEKTMGIAIICPLSPRREFIVRQLYSKGIPVTIIQGWNFERDSILFKHKFLLNIHYTPDYKVFEEIRCNRCLFNGMTVITEKSLPWESDIKQGIIEVDYENLVETVINCLKL